MIFFSENIKSTAQITGVVGQLRQAAAQSPVHQPLLLMTDQEGGLVRRLPGAPTMSEKQIGQAADAQQQAAAAGDGAGQNLAGVGMNFNLAPVLDVFRTPGDFDDSAQRSYSQDPAKVNTPASAASSPRSSRPASPPRSSTSPASAAATTQREHRQGAGHAHRLRSTRCAPSTSRLPVAIAPGVKSVMLSWAIYPALDTKPAGMSATIIQRAARPPRLQGRHHH